MPPNRRRDDDYDDDDDYDRPRPKKKKKAKSVNPALIVLPIVAVGVIVAGGIVAYAWFSGKDKETAQAPPPNQLQPQLTGQPKLVPGPGPANPGPAAGGPNLTTPAPKSSSPAPTKPTGKVGLAVWDTAMEIDGEDIDGKKFKLSDYRGKVVVLDFWGDW